MSFKYEEKKLLINSNYFIGIKEKNRLYLISIGKTNFLTYNNKNKNKKYTKLIYKKSQKTKLFREKFIIYNNKLRIILNNKDMKIKEYFNANGKIKIKKENIKNIIDMSFIFYDCTSLKSIKNFPKLNTKNFTNIFGMFYNCNSIKTLPDISKWNTKNITDMSFIFFNCSSLKSLPDISKWNTNNVTEMICMFYKCEQIISLPDISEWNTNNVTNMSGMFYMCKSLESLPDK